MYQGNTESPGYHILSLGMHLFIVPVTSNLGTNDSIIANTVVNGETITTDHNEHSSITSVPFIRVNVLCVLSYYSIYLGYSQVQQANASLLCIVI